MADEAAEARLSSFDRILRQRRTAAAPGSAFVAPLIERLNVAVESATNCLLSLQTEDAYWVGELEADTTLESDYIFFLKLLGRATPGRIRKLAHTVRSAQLPDGGWNIYAGGPSELNATVKAYLALKLAGDLPASPHMARARERAIALGGLESTNSFARFYLALSGTIGWDNVPAMPPELILLPSWFPMNLYEMSSWTRGIVVPLTLLYALKPKWQLHASSGATAVAYLDELFATPKRTISSFRWDGAVITWRNFFLAANAVFRFYEALPWKPFREAALRRASRWMIQHLERSEGLGAIYPAMVNAIMALVALGYPPDDPLTARELRHLERFEIEDADSMWLQPCLSPIWDTALAMAALEEAGLHSAHPDLVRATAWLLENQVLGPGDWQVKNPQTPPGGWAFEFRNDFYPDVDDTAFVLMSLQNVAFPSPERLKRATQRGLNWVVSMQNRDGGWGAFDRDNTRFFLTRVPFADHNAMIDP
jgi:squalene-hopene/tetraprenyl-beta-curcumene cyclase